VALIGKVAEQRKVRNLLMKKTTPKKVSITKVLLITNRVSGNNEHLRKGGQ